MIWDFGITVEGLGLGVSGMGFGTWGSGLVFTVKGCSTLPRLREQVTN